MAQAGRDVVGAVQPGIHDEALPAGGGAGFFKIHAHYQQGFRRNPAGEFGEAHGIFQAVLCVVDRAGARNEKKPLIATGKNARNFRTRPDHKIEISFRGWDFRCESHRGRQRYIGPHMEV